MTRMLRLLAWGLCLLAGLCQGDVIVSLRKTLRPYRIYEDMPARFGQGVPDEGLLGYLIPAEPITACSPLKGPPTMPDHPDIPTLGWIALIRRSGVVDPECTFEDKVRAAMEANFSAAIVYNHAEDELIPMGGSDSGLIPSVFLTHSDGEKLRQHYTYSEGWKYLIKITDNTPFDINAYLLPFAIVVGICFLVMLAIMVFKCVQDRRRERRHRLPKSSLKKIPTKKFTAGMEAQHETCCICLDDYVIGDKLRILPCSHAYHVKCIDPWLLKNKRVCPQCRKKVFASGEVPPSDSESETEDEQAPLLARARPHAHPGGTFTTLRENPFRRAARRLAARSAPAHTDTGLRPGQEQGEESGSDTEEEDELQHRASLMGNQLLAEVTIEQPRVQRADSPTFARMVSGQAELARVYHHEDQQASEDQEQGAKVEEEGARQSPGDSHC